MSSALQRLLGYIGVTIALAVGYYIYVLSTHPPSPKRETFLSEVGEGVGEVAMWMLLAVYVRTVAKLALGQGPLSRRLLPNYSAPASGAYVQQVLAFLDRTHVYLGIAAVALALLHIAMMGLHPGIWFFPVVLALIIWQAAFGMLLAWRRTPRDVRRWSYFVHAQLVTGVAIGVFAYFGHLLIDD